MEFVQEQKLESRDWMGLNWSEWKRLDRKTDLRDISTTSGIYRVRHQEREGLEYIGETGSSLKERIGHLSLGIRSEKMPFRDPHTAAPCLWSVQDKIGEGLEVSFCNPEITRSERDRKGLEAAMIAMHRKVEGKSPTANFGRIIQGYKQSSYRKKGLVGGKDSSQNRVWESLPPLDWNLKESVKSGNWMGLNWSKPQRLEDRLNVELPETGFYRIWFPKVSPPLAYIGQTKSFQNRLRKHQKIFGDGARFSTTTLEDVDTHAKKLELETELIGVHFLQQNAAPKGQWGERKRYS